jgi:hypothetical protein
MDELNSVNAEQEQVVDVPGTGTDNGVTTELEKEQPQEPAKPVQTPEENAQYAKIRREAEQKAAELAQQKIDQHYKAMYAGQINPYNGKPIDSEAAYKEYEQQHQVAQMAEKNGITVQEQQELLRKALLQSPEFRQTAEEAEKAKAEANELRGTLDKITFSNDLAEIKKINPKETAKTIEDLGITFMRARAMGLDNLTAYEIAKAEKQRLNPVPPSMGDVNSSGTDESEFYTIEQLKSMTSEEVHKNWSKVQKSRERLFKGV